MQNTKNLYWEVFKENSLEALNLQFINSLMWSRLSSVSVLHAAFSESLATSGQCSTTLLVFDGSSPWVRGRISAPEERLPRAKRQIQIQLFNTHRQPSPTNTHRCHKLYYGVRTRPLDGIALIGAHLKSVMAVHVAITRLLLRCRRQLCSLSRSISTAGCIDRKWNL